MVYWLTDTGSDILVSFDTVGLFANVPVEEVLEIMRNKLVEDDTLAEHLILEVDTITECVIKPQTSNWQVLPQKIEHGYGELCFQW